MAYLDLLRINILKLDSRYFKINLKCAIERRENLNDLVVNPRNTNQRFSLLDSCFFMLKRSYALPESKYVTFKRHIDPKVLQTEQVLEMIWMLFQAGVDFTQLMSCDRYTYLNRAELALLKKPGDTKFSVSQSRLLAVQEILRAFSEHPSRKYPFDAHVQIGRSLLRKTPKAKIVIEGTQEYTGYIDRDGTILGGGQQTAHLKEAHKAAGEAIYRLHKAYPDIIIQDTLSDLYAHLIQLRTSLIPSKHNWPVAERYVTLPKVDIALRYLACIAIRPMSMPYIDSVTGVSIDAWLAIAWHTLQQDMYYSKDDDKWVDLGELTPDTEEFQDRLCLLVNELINICRSYNEEVDSGKIFKADAAIPKSFDDKTCDGGAFTKLHTLLMGRHPAAPMVYEKFTLKDLDSLRSEVFERTFKSLPKVEQANIDEKWDDYAYEVDAFLTINKTTGVLNARPFHSVKKQFTSDDVPVEQDDIDCISRFIALCSQNFREAIIENFGIIGESVGDAIVPSEVAVEAIGCAIVYCSLPLPVTTHPVELLASVPPPSPTIATQPALLPTPSCPESDDRTWAEVVATHSPNPVVPQLRLHAVRQQQWRAQQEADQSGHRPQGAGIRY